MKQKPKPCKCHEGMDSKEVHGYVVAIEKERDAAIEVAIDLHMIVNRCHKAPPQLRNCKSVVDNLIMEKVAEKWKR